MALLECKVGKGLRPAEVSVEIKDAKGRSRFLPIDTDFVQHEAGKDWLPVSVVAIDQAKKQAVVGLPVETDSGAHRILVRLDQLRNLTEVLT